MRNLLKYFHKKRPVYHHIIAASIIVAYWWAIWNLLDAILLSRVINTGQIVSVILIALGSIFMLFAVNFDFSDL